VIGWLLSVLPKIVNLFCILFQLLQRKAL
jgi:hypothetical protein